MIFHQVDNARLGNTINITPVLQAYHDKYGEKVLAYFETEYVKECFLDAPFLKIVDEPFSDEQKQLSTVVRSTDYKRKKYETPDYLYLWEKYSKIYGFTEMPNTYVDGPEHSYKDKFAVISNGCGEYSEPAYVNLKVIPMPTLEAVLSRVPIKTYAVGSNLDAGNMPETDYHFFGSIRASLAAIKASEYVITNEGGMYHAAIALGKKTFVMWQDTHPIKNQAPGGYISKGNHFKNIQHFINENT